MRGTTTQLTKERFVFSSIKRIKTKIKRNAEGKNEGPTLSEDYLGFMTCGFSQFVCKTTSARRDFYESTYLSPLFLSYSFTLSLSLSRNLPLSPSLFYSCYTIQGESGDYATFHPLLLNIVPSIPGGYRISSSFFFFLSERDKLYELFGKSSFVLLLFVIS